MPDICCLYNQHSSQGPGAHFPQLEEDEPRTHQPSLPASKKDKRGEGLYLTRGTLLTGGAVDRGFLSDDAPFPAPFTLFP